MYIGLHVKYPIFLSDINETLTSATDSRKLIRYAISWGVRPVEGELFHTDKRMELHDKANSSFSQFYECA